MGKKFCMTHFLCRATLLCSWDLEILPTRLGASAQFRWFRLQKYRRTTRFNEFFSGFCLLLMSACVLQRQKQGSDPFDQLNGIFHRKKGSGCVQASRCSFSNICHIDINLTISSTVNIQSCSKTTDKDLFAENDKSQDTMVFWHFCVVALALAVCARAVCRQNRCVRIAEPWCFSDTRKKLCCSIRPVPPVQEPQAGSEHHLALRLSSFNSARDRTPQGQNKCVGC